MIEIIGSALYLTILYVVFGLNVESSLAIVRGKDNENQILLVTLCPVTFMWLICILIKRVCASRKRRKAE